MASLLQCFTTGSKFSILFHSRSRALSHRIPPCFLSILSCPSSTRVNLTYSSEATSTFYVNKRREGILAHVPTLVSPLQKSQPASSDFSSFELFVQRLSISFLERWKKRLRHLLLSHSLRCPPHSLEVGEVARCLTPSRIPWVPYGI